MYQEQGWTGTPITNAASDADTVGQINDPSDGHLVQAITDVRRPTLETNGTRSVLRFDGSDDSFEVHNSQSAFDFFQNDGTGAILILAEKDSAQDSTFCYMLDSSTGSGANPGMTFRMQAGNQVRFMTDPGAGAATFDYTSTFTFQNSDGFQWIILDVDNANGGRMCKVPAGATFVEGTHCETFSRTTAPAADSGGTQDNLHVSSRSGAVNSPCNWDVSQLYIYKTTVTDAQIQAHIDHDPSARDSDSLLDCTGTQADCYCNFVSHCWDGTNTSFMYQDITGRTTAVSSNNDPVGTWANRIDSNGRLNRDANAPATGQRPLYQSDGTGLLFDGVDDEYTGINNGQRGGGASWIAVFRNADDTNGSHIYTASGRLCVTGDNYASNTPPEAPNSVAYACCHPSTGSCGTTELGSETGFNSCIWDRDGSDWGTTCRGGGAETQNNGTAGSNANSFNPTDIGEETIAGWQLDDRMLFGAWINASMPDAMKTALNTQLATDFGQSL